MISKSISTTRVNNGGNYCGHNPLLPQLSLAIPMKAADPVTGKGGLPKVLRLLSERLESYFDNPKLIPSLNSANGSCRKQRSERREACVRVLNGILKFTDLVTLRVGVPETDGFKFLPLRVLEKHIGLETRRIVRALRDLRHAGLISSTQPREMDEDGNYKGLAAIRCVSKNLFAMFGLDQMLAKQRELASKRFRKKLRKLQQEEHLQYKRSNKVGVARIKAIFDRDHKPLKVKRSVKSAHTVIERIIHGAPSNDPPDDKELELRRVLMLKAAELKEQYPHLNQTQCYEAAINLI